MRIGELAQRTGTTTRALRFYEDQGLLPARRSANGYRDYDENDLQLVKEIQTLQTIGLTLDDGKMPGTGLERSHGFVTSAGPQ